MKTTITLLLVSILSLPSIAYARDIDKGTIQLSGTSRFVSTSSEVDVDGLGESDVDTTEFVLDLSYFGTQNVGFGLVYSRETIDVDDSDEETNLLGPAVVFNFGTQPNVSFQLSAAYFLIADTEFSDPSGDLDFEGTGFGISASVLYFFSENIAANFGVSMVSLSQEEKDLDIDVDTDGTGFGIGLTVLID